MPWLVIDQDSRARERPSHGSEGGKRLRLGQEASPNHTALIVEDEVFIRFMLADELRGAGYKVIEAATADEPGVHRRRVSHHQRYSYAGLHGRLAIRAEGAI